MSKKAHDTLVRLLNPVPYDQFFDEIVGKRLLHDNTPERAGRAAIIGPDPQAKILESFDEFAHNLTCHSGSAKVPPPQARRVGSSAEFEGLIREYHKVDYTVRIPETKNLSPELLQLCRALEAIFENPASAAIFWSKAGANAPVHHDEVDLFIVQLTGKKRWFISAEPPTLPNMWKTAGEGAPPLERHHVIDVVPGDLIYMPRGTSHTVESTTESIHVAVGVLPVTVREAMSAVVDYLSEMDLFIRTGITDRADDLSRGVGKQQVTRRLRRALEDLLARCQSDEFIHDAMERRRARMIEDLPKLKSDGAGAQILPDSWVRHHSLAVSHVLATRDLVDFRQPGERLLIHRGAEESLRFIATTPEFRVADIPGALGDDVKVALVSRLVMSGFLVPAN
jgi:hypothetical protein